MDNELIWFGIVAQILQWVGRSETRRLYRSEVGFKARERASGGFIVSSLLNETLPYSYNLIGLEMKNS